MMIRPLYTHKATELLLIGPPSSGKRTLARQLMRCTDVFFSINVAESFSSESLGSIPSIDYVMLVVDITNGTSTTLLEKALQGLSPRHLSFQCCVIVTKVDQAGLAVIDTNEVNTCVEKYSEAQVFHVNLKDERERRKVCEQLARLVRINTLQQKGIQPVLLRSIAPPRQWHDSDNPNQSVSEEDHSTNLL
ncbi:hypothetical protein J3Q64DRAFT_1751916 [Phycomyces blakesleeanus]|uniref:Centromere protein M n=1 Tax=Phycomyces blakesleeanus TaxID=4837 RepID=A0ABR3AUU4_PHYBL